MCFRFVLFLSKNNAEGATLGNFEDVMCCPASLLKHLDTTAETRTSRLLVWRDTSIVTHFAGRGDIGDRFTVLRASTGT